MHSQYAGCSHSLILCSNSCCAAVKLTCTHSISVTAVMLLSLWKAGFVLSCVIIERICAPNLKNKLYYYAYMLNVFLSKLNYPITRYPISNVNCK